jgi:hypothetical protein
VGSIRDWAERLPGGLLFLFFLFLSPFLFLISDLVYFFCINAPKHFKQVSKFLKSSKQPSKPIGNMFSEAKQDFLIKIVN